MVWSNKGIVHRPTVTGTQGMVASAHPLASFAGAKTLLAGGNAIDAAIAVSAALNVVEPFMSGLGGAGAMLIHRPGGQTETLLYGGVFPEAVSIDVLDEKSIDIGPRASSVPAAPAGWMAAHDRYGSLNADLVFAPAIELAETGYALTVTGSHFFNMFQDRLSPTAKSVYLPQGKRVGAGSIIRQPELAESYRLLGIAGVDAFYDGPIGAEIVRSVQEAGGLITASDLQRIEPQWISPSLSTYRGYELRSTGWPLTSYEILLTLNILEGFDLNSSGPGTANTLHTMIEAMKLSMTDRITYGSTSERSAEGLLRKDYAKARMQLVDFERAQPTVGDRYSSVPVSGTVQPGSPLDFLRECTTHFDVIDADGNTVSVTQSLGGLFGSGFMAGSTGIMMNNFLFFFDLDPDSPMSIDVGELSSGPLSPVMLFKNDQLFLTIGTPGAFGIPHTTVQMISNVVDHGYSAQAAIEAPRFRLYEGLRVGIEDRVSKDVLLELRQRGHQIEIIDGWSPSVGGGQGILIDPETGAYSGGADPRRDGYVLGI